MRGFLRTLWQVARRLGTAKATREYPDEAPPLASRTRGRIVLTRDPSGRERCVACNLCAAVCPVDCIDLAKAETEDGRWYPEFFRVNFARCIFCGMCEEACPTLAIQLVPDFELSEYRRDALVYEKEHLTIDGPGKHPDYSYWDVAGKPIEGAAPGTGDTEFGPIDLKALRP